MGKNCEVIYFKLDISNLERSWIINCQIKFLTIDVTAEWNRSRVQPGNQQVQDNRSVEPLLP